jgi:hypothetical protein
MHAGLHFVISRQGYDIRFLQSMSLCHDLLLCLNVTEALVGSIFDVPVGATRFRRKHAPLPGQSDHATVSDQIGLNADRHGRHAQSRQKAKY